jgi:cobalt-zinc-cadmium efflux system outer membrane protein
MIQRKSRLIVLAVLGVFGILQALAAAETPLTLEQCIELAVRQNPLILSSFEKFKASQARERQALALPQPSLNIDSDLQPRLLDFRGSGESYWGFSQFLEFPFKRSVRGKIASRESEEIRSEIELLKLDIGFQVKQAFFGVQLAQEKIKCAQQDLELSADFLSKAEQRKTAGDIAEVEVMRARVEYAKTTNVLKIAQNEKRLAAAMLNYLLARKKYDPLEIRGELKRSFVPLDIEKLKQQALMSRPEIKSIGFAQEKESLKKTQAALSYFPDFDLGFSRHRITGAPATWDFTLSLSIPLFFWQPRQGPIAEAEANLKSLEREADHFRDMIALEVEEAVLNALSASDQIRLFEEQILTQAEDVYGIFLFKFEKGEIGGIELIEARWSLNEARKAYADTLFNYRVTIAALEKSVGHSLERGQDE